MTVFKVDNYIIESTTDCTRVTNPIVFTVYKYNNFNHVCDMVYDNFSKSPIDFITESLDDLGKDTLEGSPLEHAIYKGKKEVINGK